jgi:hypothetical protein
VIRTAVGLGLGLAVSIALSGCGLVTLIHDSVIGPVSPIGRINTVTVGSDFHVTEQGPVAELGGDSRLRPYPRDMIQRLGTPASIWSLAQGIEAFLTSISPVATRETRVGRGAGEQLPAELRPGVPVDVALALLGPPDLWVRRSGGSFMLYRGISQRAWSFYLGVPPPAAVLVPIPGISNLRFSYRSERDRASKLMLFFDEQDVLVGTSASVEASGRSE